MKYFRNLQFKKENPLLFLKDIYDCPRNISGKEVLEAYNSFINYLTTLA
jgi:hypothetical protein